MKRRLPEVHINLSTILQPKENRTLFIWFSVSSFYHILTPNMLGRKCIKHLYRAFSHYYKHYQNTLYIYTWKQGRTQGQRDEVSAQGPTLFIFIRDRVLLINMVTRLPINPYASCPTGAKNGPAYTFKVPKGLRKQRVANPGEKEREIDTGVAIELTPLANYIFHHICVCYSSHK